MTIAEANEILRSYKWLKKESEKLRDAYNTYTAAQWRDTREYKQITFGLFSKWLQAERKASMQAERIEEVLMLLPPLERNVLRLYFLCGQSWRRTALELGYSEEHVKGYLRQKALQAFAVAWPKEE